MKQKILIIGRHGKVIREGGLSTNRLLPNSFKEIYMNINKLLKDYHFSKNECFGFYSNKERTLYTLKAILVKTIGMKSKKISRLPSTVDELGAHNFSGIEINNDFRIHNIYSDVNINIAKKDLDATADFWLSNRKACFHKGVKITPFYEIRRRLISLIQESIDKLINEDKNLGIIIGHEPWLSVGLLSLIELSTGKRINSIKEYGGTIQMAEFFKLCINKRRSDYQINFGYRGINYSINYNDFRKK